MTLSVGVSVRELLLGPPAAVRRAILDEVAAAGLDHVTLGDHVSFHGGTGFDGLVTAASVLSTHDTLPVLVGVYQLVLRHPLVVARQLATLSQLSPGRLTFGVGVGGEDRSEIANCGVDPSTRGRRLDESLALLRRLATGDAVDHDGEFFAMTGAAVLPPPQPPVPLVIGGAGDHAVRRAAEVGDGWLGIFCSARRYAETVGRIREAAADAGRAPDWFGVTVWCGFDADPRMARDRLGATMQELYRLPPDRFAHLAPAGTPAQVAEFLAAYVSGGARHVTVVPVAASATAEVEAVAEVRRLLLTH